MSTSILLDSPLTPTRSSFPRSSSFLSKSQENVIEQALPQSVSRPNSRRSSRIFAANLNIPAREDSLGSFGYGINNAFNSNRLWAESPVAYDSPASSFSSNKTKSNSTLISTPFSSRESESPGSNSIGNSWGIQTIGRGFDWTWSEEPAQVEISAEQEEKERADVVQPLPTEQPQPQRTLLQRSLSSDVVPTLASSITQNPPKMTLSLSEGILIPQHSNGSTRPTTPSSLGSSVPASPRYRRRSSQKRFSLVSGRLSYSAPPSPPPESSLAVSSTSRAPKLLRLASTSSFISVNSVMTGPPTPGKVHYAGDRSIAEFVIQGDVGQGAYGLVKRGREVMADGSYGPELIIKEVIKSRILADCWKKHPVHGTIPIEIYVMLAVSSAAYALPPARPWDPYRGSTPPPPAEDSAFPNYVWEDGKIVKGHPNICPLIDFFEDKNFYYLILPSALPPPDSEPRPKDLFDLVEIHPQGLPPALVRSYLGQMADAMAFLHNRGIVHRDIKDENVVLSADGKHCWLIDFGSAGVVRKTGWNSFSGTLDYASPEILRGEFYTGKEQDVWAFGVVAYVLLVGECPFATATDAQEGLAEGTPAYEALTARCAQGHEQDGLEEDEGGALEDAFALVRSCLHTGISDRPTFEEVIQHRFLCGAPGWSGDRPPRSPSSSADSDQ